MCAEGKLWEKKYSWRQRRPVRGRQSQGELPWGGASKRLLKDVGRRCLGPREAIGKTQRPSPPPTSWPAPETSGRGEGWRGIAAAAAPALRETAGREGGSWGDNPPPFLPLWAQPPTLTSPPSAGARTPPNPVAPLAPTPRLRQRHSHPPPPLPQPGWGGGQPPRPPTPLRILRLMMLHIKYLYGIRVEVRGAHHFPPSQPYVVVSNHQSSLDLLGMMEVLPGRCVPIAKRELLWAGSAGLACWLAGVIFIDRKRTGDAISVMSEVAQTLLTQDVRVWVFPEGTRNHNGSMLPFKRGAFHLAVQAQVPIVPIVMSSYQDFYCKKERRFTSGQCQVRVLPPVPTEGLTPDDVPALADRVRHSMLTVFREISTDGRGGGDYLKKPGGVGEARL
ncbi:1-acyl-sn-glycerol-3-phosphate acyltransferase alpha isoform X1 [Camelus ferus]|uniref:1-acyl-sn-glycerol-3-phosphate acyltransferase n=1 Tax=Camelus ferus TaxID=419612 RepID=A0A8B8RL26_CAMFR|nr:1-acyl-sn-glycerol-3-phosphate acyltransferase alpha isoform X1 [Camelus ferus]